MQYIQNGCRESGRCAKNKAWNEKKSKMVEMLLMCDTEILNMAFFIIKNKMISCLIFIFGVKYTARGVILLINGLKWFRMELNTMGGN